MTLSNLSRPVVDFYIDNGYTLFPLNGKVPPKDFHWREAIFDPFFEPPRTNFGVQLKADDLVIDIDPRNFKDGVNSLINLRALCDWSEETLSVLTGAGGTHYYFKKPAGLKIRKNLKEFPGIDFISEGGYVVGASSIHPETKREYVLVPRGIKKAPQSILDLIQKQEIIELTKGVDAYVNDEQTTDRYCGFLRTAPIAIEGESGDKTTFSVIAFGRDYGLSPDNCYACVSREYNQRCQPPWDENELRKKVENVYKYASGSLGANSPSIAFPKEDYEVWSENQDKYFHRTDSGKIKMDQHNAALMFSPSFPLEGLLAMDLFSHNIIFKHRAPWHKNDAVKIWSDEEATLCRHWLSTNKKFEPTQQLMHDAAVVAAYQYQFHPVKQYFESLVWDGHKRLHNWMHTYLGAVDDKYVRAIGIKTLVACVKRVYEPGCKFDYITVLEGNQDTGKSTAWRILASKAWFGDTPIDISKEWSIMKTFGKIMYEWAEMETYRKSNTQAMKAFLSSDTDTVRLPYNRTIQAIPRQGIFVGTFNPEQDRDIGWLHDTTGNRRYWIVSTSVMGEIRNDKLEQVRDQLWAEAKAMYDAGTPIYFEDQAVIQQAKEEQSMRMGRDTWEEAVMTWVNADHNIDTIVYTGDEIFRLCLGGNMTGYKRAEMLRISNIMQKIGWKKGSHYHPERKNNVMGYRRPTEVLI